MWEEPLILIADQSVQKFTESGERRRSRQIQKPDAKSKESLFGDGDKRVTLEFWSLFEMAQSAHRSHEYAHFASWSLKSSGSLTTGTSEGETVHCEESL